MNGKMKNGKTCEDLEKNIVVFYHPGHCLGFYLDENHSIHFEGGVISYI